MNRRSRVGVAEYVWCRVCAACVWSNVSGCMCLFGGMYVVKCIRLHASVWWHVCGQISVGRLCVVSVCSWSHMGDHVC